MYSFDIVVTLLRGVVVEELSDRALLLLAERRILRPRVLDEGIELQAALICGLEEKTLSLKGVSGP